jgi:hypothetical protein
MTADEAAVVARLAARLAAATAALRDFGIRCALTVGQLEAMLSAVAGERGSSRVLEGR